MDVVHPAIDRYMKELASVDDEPVVLEMEELAEKEDFPIIGRLCGRTLELLARSIGAKRVFELGSGYGYSAYWFARATGPDGEIHLTDTDAGNEKKALDYLGRAGLDKPINYHVSDALEAFNATTGDFDIIYCDIDKAGYPDAWRAARDRIRVGGYWISDNMLWFGRVTGEVSGPDIQAGATEAIKETNHMVAEDPDFRDAIIPTRDGMLVALRIR